MRTDSRSKGLLLGVAAGLVVVGGLLIALPFVVGAFGASSQARSSASTTSTSEWTEPVGVESTATASVAATVAASVPASSAVSTAAPVAVVATATVASATSAPSKPAGPSLDAYRGLGSWVDIYDDKAWADPTAAVANMASHGVRTLYLETGNSRSSFAIKDTAKVGEFINAAHARKILVVAWYLPDMKRPAVDYDRIAKAINFRTSTGQKFDSFTLDIESGGIASVSARNKALSSLSARIRALVGSSYPLGACIPSPTGLAKKGSYWGNFPYTMLASKYDVFVPMSYYTYHGKGASAAYADTLSNVRILRSKKGCSTTPIHLIGGIAENSSAAEVKAFVRASNETKCIGASFYSWPGTTKAHWAALAAVKQ